MLYYIFYVNCKKKKVSLKHLSFYSTFYKFLSSHVQNNYVGNYANVISKHSTCKLTKSVAESLSLKHLQETFGPSTEL